MDKRTITAKRIELQMKKHNIIQQIDLSNQLNEYFHTKRFNTSKINRWLKKENDTPGDNYQLDDMKCLCEFFGCSLDYLFGLTDSDIPNERIDYKRLHLSDQAVCVLETLTEDDVVYQGRYLHNSLNLLMTSPYFKVFLYDFMALQLFDFDKYAEADLYISFADELSSRDYYSADDRKRKYVGRLQETLLKLNDSTIYVQQRDRKYCDRYSEEIKTSSAATDEQYRLFAEEMYRMHKDSLEKCERQKESNLRNLKSYRLFIQEHEEFDRWLKEHPEEVDELYDQTEQEEANDGKK